MITERRLAVHDGLLHGVKLYWQGYEGLRINLKLQHRGIRGKRFVTRKPHAYTVFILRRWLEWVKVGMQMPVSP